MVTFPPNHITITTPRQLVLNTIELDESKICTCLAISDTPAGGSGEEPEVMMEQQGLPMPQHIMPGGGRGVPIA